MVGWIAEDMLTPVVREELSVMQPGQLSTPVKTDEGYKLFVLHAVRDPADSAVQQEIVHLMQLFCRRQCRPNNVRPLCAI